MTIRATRRAALYLRVSTDKQTVENQELQLRQVAERRGWEVVEVYDDAGISGAKGREAAQAAMDWAWADAHSSSYPPTIIHVTDGASTDGDPSAVAAALRQMSTSDGECLLFNLHISTTGGAGCELRIGLQSRQRVSCRLAGGCGEHICQGAEMLRCIPGIRVAPPAI